MEAFTLDTSGAVHGVIASDGDLCAVLWSDLSPFAQGYVEASWQEWGHLHPGKAWGSLIKPFGFSDLAPETLAAILKDCAAFQNIAVGLGNTKLGKVHGERFWRGRNDGTLRGTAFFAAFPPLTPYLDDAGKVRLREAGQ